MTQADIDEVVDMFLNATRVAKEAGFDGVQLHGAHGFLLSQFLSPHTNRREDEYGGTPWKRLALLRRLVTEIRQMCPPPFCLGVETQQCGLHGKWRGCSKKRDSSKFAGL